MALREGFLAGIPVAASNHGAMAEAIEHDRTGLLFEPGNPDELFRQLKRLEQDRELRQRLVAAPKPIWDHEQNANAVLKVYQAVC